MAHGSGRSRSKTPPVATARKPTNATNARRIHSLYSTEVRPIRFIRRRRSQVRMHSATRDVSEYEGDDEQSNDRA